MALAMTQPLTWARDSGALTLDELLEEAREAYRLELHIPLAVEQPPVLSSLDGHGQRVVDVDRAAAQIGWSMSAQLDRRIGHPEGYGNVFPVARALHDLDGWCRGRHLEGRGGPWVDHEAAAGTLWSRLTGTRPLCGRLAHYAVVAHAPIPRLAHVERLQLPVVRRLLKDALEHMWAQRREWAHADESGVGEVLAAQRRERREAKARAEASRAEGAMCRYCERPYDASSQEPCPGSADTQASEADAAAMAEAGFTLLCSPA